MTIVTFPSPSGSASKTRSLIAPLVKYYHTIRLGTLSVSDLGVIGIVLMIAGVAYFGIYTIFDMRFAQQDRELERIVSWGETMAPSKLISP